MHGHKGQPLSIEITVEPHGGIRGRCPECRRSAPGYDRLPERRWLFVPLWGIPTYFLYAPRRVECIEHGVVVEHIPWIVNFLCLVLSPDAGHTDGLGAGCHDFYTPKLKRFQVLLRF